MMSKWAIIEIASFGTQTSPNESALIIICGTILQNDYLLFQGDISFGGLEIQAPCPKGKAPGFSLPSKRT